MWTLALIAALAHAAPPDGADAPAPPPGGSELYQGTRIVSRYLDAVRLAAPSPTASQPARVLPAAEEDFALAKALTAPRTLAAVRVQLAAGRPHGMAPWTRADRDRFLESFDLMGARRAPRGAIVVTVRERFYVVASGGERLVEKVSEYLAARIGDEWRVVDRRGGARFSDEEIAADYDGYW